MKIVHPGNIACAVLLALLFLPGGDGAARAAEPAGNLLLEEGRVKIRRQGKSTTYREAGANIPLSQGDIIHSGPDSKAVITLAETGDKISLYPNSHFALRESSIRKSRFGLTIGKALFGVISKRRTGAFTVKTATATIGVKGTEFVAGTDGEQTFVLTTEGVVGLANEAFPDMEVLVEANQASVAQRFEPPTAAVEVSPEQRDQVVRGRSLDSFDALNLQQDPGEFDAAREGAEAAQEASEQVEDIGSSGGSTGGIIFDLSFEGYYY